MKAEFSAMLLFVAVTTEATAGSAVLDQQNVFNTYTMVGIEQNHSAAQTLTCAQGGLLSRVDVEVERPFATASDLVLSIWSLANDGSLLTQLANGSLPATAIPSEPQTPVVSFTRFSQDVAVTPGEQLGIRLDSQAPDTLPFFVGYAWLCQNPGQYAGGRMFVYGDSSIDQPGSDFYFQTFVTPVPEPSLTSISVLGALVWFGRRLSCFQSTKG